MSNFLDFLPGINGLIQGGLNLISGNKTNKTNLKIARETNQAQIDLAKYQADQNLNLWNLNNEYNSPAAQMQRYQDAGLNPNLIYGSGSASAGNSSSPAKGFEAPTLQRASVNNYMPQASQLFLNGLQTAMNVRKTAAETDAIYQNVANLKVDNTLKQLNAHYLELRNAKSETEREFWTQQIMADLARTESTTMLNWSNSQNVDVNRRLTEALRPMEIELRSAQVQQALESVKSAKFLNSLQPLTRQKLISEIANISLNATGRELENQITRTLINSGINLRGSVLERIVGQIVDNLSKLDSNDHKGFGWLIDAAKFINK